MNCKKQILLSLGLMMAPLFSSGPLEIQFMSVATAGEIKPKHGVEFTFTNPRLIRKGKRAGIMSYASEANLEAREQWAQKMTAICNSRPEGHPEKCTITREKKKKSMNIYTIQYPDGWSYSVTIDPLVIEVNASPITTEEAIKMKGRIQRDIFDVAKKVVSFSANKPSENVGLTPHKSVGGGHIHFDMKTTFNNDPLLFRNFLVDYANHPTISIGSLGNDANNGPPLAVLTPEQRQAFAEVIYGFDVSRPKWSIERLAQEITDRVYTQTRAKPGIFRNRHAWTPAWKYQALNLSRIIKPELDPEERTLEIRALQPQKSADYFIKVIELFDARINMLKKIQKPIPYLRSEVSAVVASKDPQQVIDELYAYVVASGLDWEDYKQFLPDEVIEKVAKGKIKCKDGRNVRNTIPQYDHKDEAFKKIYQVLINNI